MQLVSGRAGPQTWRFQLHSLHNELLKLNFNVHILKFIGVHFKYVEPTQLSVYVLRLLISADQFQRGLALLCCLHHKGDYCAPGMITEIQVIYSRVISAWKISNKYSAETWMCKYMPLKHIV